MTPTVCEMSDAGLASLRRWRYDAGAARRRAHIDPDLGQREAPNQGSPLGTQLAPPAIDAEV